MLRINPKLVIRLGTTPTGFSRKLWSQKAFLWSGGGGSSSSGALEAAGFSCQALGKHHPAICEVPRRRLSSSSSFEFDPGDNVGLDSEKSERELGCGESISLCP